MPEFSNIDVFDYRARCRQLELVCKKVLDKYKSTKEGESYPCLALNVTKGKVTIIAEKFSITMVENELLQKATFLKVRVANKEFEVNPENFGFVNLTILRKNGREVYLASSGEDKLVPEKARQNELEILSVQEELLKAAQWFQKNVLDAA